MRKDYFLAILLGSGLAMASEQVTAQQGAVDPRPRFEDYRQAGAFDEFAWDLFEFINWPAKAGERGISDPSADLAEKKRSTWETWKDLREIMRLDGAKPEPWEDWPVAVFDPQKPDRYFRAKGFYSSQIVPLIDGYHLMTKDGEHAYMGLRSNKAVFDYIVGRGFYNDNGLDQWVDSPSEPPMDFPVDAMQTKSTWVKLSDDDYFEKGERFHVAVIEEPSGRPHYFALVGLHIMSKVQPTWFWATFEHVEAQEVTAAPKVTPVSASAAAENARRRVKHRGTRWENYELRGSQWSFVDQNGAPTTLANTTMETRIQKSSSCITCHALASDGRAGDGTIIFLGSGPGGSLGGYVGEPDWMRFCESGFFDNARRGILGQTGEDFCSAVGLPHRYRSTDYVWLFRLANQLKTKGF